MINNHEIIGIVAVDENWAIGKNNSLLYYIPIDLKFFKEATSGNIVVCGYNTLMSFPNKKPLPNREHIVLTRKELPNGDKIRFAHSVAEVENIIRSIDNNKEVYICGGESVYHQMIDMCDKVLVTKIKASTADADAFFPNLDKSENWEMAEGVLTVQDTSSNLTVEFTTYKKHGRTN